MNKLDILLMAATVVCALFAWSEGGKARMKALYEHSQHEAPGHWLITAWWASWTLVFLIWWFVR